MTKHTCGGPHFGRLAPYGECPRCDELHDGAPTRKGWQADHYAAQRHRDEERSRAIANHFRPNGPHARGECGPVCTAFDS